LGHLGTLVAQRRIIVRIFRTLQRGRAMRQLVEMVRIIRRVAVAHVSTPGVGESLCSRVNCKALKSEKCERHSA
jgi:hypothetical protein